MRSEVKNIERRIDQFLERIINADSPTLIKTYEAKVTELEYEKASLSGKLAETTDEPLDFENTFQTAFHFIGNPHRMWVSGDIGDKRLVLKLTFDGQLPYRRNVGFQTAALALPFKVLRGFNDPKSGMVVGGGYSANCSDKLIEAIQRSSKLFDSVMVAV